MPISRLSLLPLPKSTVSDAVGRAKVMLSSELFRLATSIWPATEVSARVRSSVLVLPVMVTLVALPLKMIGVRPA